MNYTCRGGTIIFAIVSSRDNNDLLLKILSLLETQATVSKFHIMKRFPGVQEVATFFFATRKR